MEQRYGFASEDAVGRVSHQLLHTISLHTLHEMESVLVDQNAWSGGLIHYHSDGSAVVVANHWHLHRDVDGRGDIVSEVHSDLVSRGTAAACQLADAIAAIAHRLSEPLTAVNNYINASQRNLQAAWPDLPRQRVAMNLAAGQIARGAEALRLLRELASDMRRAEQNEDDHP
jgi:signal transduction histidine kinase